MSDNTTTIPQELLDRFSGFPAELKALNNWAIGSPDKHPYTQVSGAIIDAKVNEPDNLLTFEQALALMVRSKAPYIGMILRPNDGYVCIDLDVKNEESHPQKPDEWTTPQQAERFKKIVDAFDSYTELSAGGFGAHIWVKGYTGLGARRDGVEVYSQERFLICTGTVLVAKPVEERQELLDILVEEIRAGQKDVRDINLEEVEQTESDEAVYDKAVNAGNSEKFTKLFQGEWSGDYKSQSEADLALMSMLAFYSKSNAQCRRMFRVSGLGQRVKATKNDRHLNYMLEVIRSRQHREGLISAQAEAMARELVATLQNGHDYKDVAAAQVAVHDMPMPVETDKCDDEERIDWPPGLVGGLARYIFNSSQRPVREIAIMTTLGFMAGVCGKAFNTYTQTGLNQYFVLIARSGVGKETLHAGISSIMAALREANPAAQQFVDFTEFASGQGLLKAVAKNPSFVNVSGEWGRRLQRMSTDDRGDGPMGTLRTQITHLYQKSGHGNLVGGITYSNDENNVGLSAGVAFSLIGETTPGTFYKALTESMMEDGFMSRFLLMEYQGKRPPTNKARVKEMQVELRQALASLCAQALTNNSRNHVDIVKPSPEAEALLAEFDSYCDNEVDGSDNEAVRQMWNRAQLKVLRIASILAVGDNWINPVIELHHAKWAHSLVMKDINTMKARLFSGDVGQGDDHTRQLKVLTLIRDFFQVDRDLQTYQINPLMREHGIIPHRYLQIRTSSMSQFRDHKMGGKIALDTAIKTLIDNGYLNEAPKDKLMEHYSFGGKAYRVISYPAEMMK